MGACKSKFLPIRSTVGTEQNLKFDPDEKWSNLYREREKNHLYKWVGVRQGGELIAAYEKEGEEGVLRFAEEKLAPMMFENGEKPQLITQSEYTKWKKAVNAQLGKNEESIEIDRSENKFREHYAQWRLNKRGVDGETVIHLLLSREEPVCSEIARILINRYPGLANDIYLGDEMFGQSALHLAIVHDDYETVQLLLSKDADVNARARGNFFLPEESKGGKMMDYQGYAYYGEYPLAFAACFGNKDIYDLLIQHKADPDLQDVYGNTILHMCVINYSNSMYSYAVRHWAKPAQAHLVNNAGYTPLTLASRLGRRQIFEEMLELMKVEFWRFSDMTCSAYPLSALDTIRPDGSTNYDSALMTVINGSTPEHLEMIGSEVIQRLLADKWKAFAARKLFERLALLIFHLVLLCIVVYLRPTELDRLYMSKPQWDDFIRCAAELATILSCVFFVFVQQLGEIRTQGLYGYIRNLQTAPAKIVFFVANLCILACVPFRIIHNRQVEEALFVFALPGSWIFLLFFARSLKLTGPFVQMIYSMIAGDMIRFAIISAIFLVSFSQVFFFVGKDMDAKQNLPEGNPHKCHITGYSIYTYSNFLETFVTLFRASMGGYDYEEFSCANYEALTKTLFVFYMFVMPIMMINILIAMMGNTYTTVIAQAEKAWRQQYAQIVMVLERSVRKERLAACQLEYSIKLNENGDNSMETRGLMVIKQTKKTRARQRKQAITNWKRIARKVIHTVQRLGPDHAKQLLHSHDRLFDDAQAVIVRPNRSPSALFPTKFPNITTEPLQQQVQIEHDRVESKASESLQISAPVSLQNDQDQWRPGSGETDILDNKMDDEVNIGRDHTISGFLSQSGSTQATSWSFGASTFAVGRGSIHGPAIEIPTIPTRAATVASSSSTVNNNNTPPPRAISPKIRTDMFRRKGSPATNTSSSNSSRRLDILDSPRPPNDQE